MNVRFLSFQQGYKVAPIATEGAASAIKYMKYINYIKFSVRSENALENLSRRL